ncbi:hypothetical protein [Halomicrococcus sp. SG-WS-1]|uniref:hypothetical protein n=1 Tax=Halomicrococcus sp. SG-WS-1 TaxID=3439057 RepID=UPI003F7A0785
MPSTRRALLSALGTALSVSLAGCSGSLRSTTVDTDTSPGRIERGLRPPNVKTQSPPNALVTVGRERSGDPRPHLLWFWNESSDRRRLALGLSRTSSSPLGSSTDRLLRRTYPLAPGGLLAVELRRPGRYKAVARIAGVKETTKVPRSRFDCNDSSTSVVVRADGTVETGGIRTSMKCSDDTL